jgi:hypothetical protein
MIQVEFFLTEYYILPQMAHSWLTENRALLTAVVTCRNTLTLNLKL